MSDKRIVHSRVKAPTKLTFQCPHCEYTITRRVPRAGEEGDWFVHSCHVALAKVKVTVSWSDTFPANEVPEGARWEE